MNQEIRNRLRNVVTKCRKLLEDSVSQELEGKYGIFARNGQVTADPKATMGHLTEEEQAARKDILDHFGHIQARGFKPSEALGQLVREIAFTHLNRFCAYKMMEAREVYIGGQKFRESVSRGINSNGVKFYLADHPDEERLFNTGHQDIAYRHFLDWLGGLLSDEIGVLFNPNDPANRLYPRQKTLDEVLDLLNGGGIRPEESDLRKAWPDIWTQDETIGWVYQYFTPRELRDEARSGNKPPANSYELAFRNQFFTPRYVVEFLTDNTLARVWYEMRKGDTKLKDQCRYLVRRPTEIFLEEGQELPQEAAEGQGDLLPEELLKLPVHVLHRPKKDPRELKILDPACGSGHFLLYCFDLLLTIYEEAYDDPELGPVLHKEYPTLGELQRHVPPLILANNLHGVDIDFRASQIAALALWLRCQRAYQELGVKNDRLKINRSNFVCAEPMPGEELMLKEFVTQLEPKFLGQVVEVVFDKMKLAGEAGSLLKIEEEIQDAVAAAKKQWLRETTQATDRKGQPLLFTQAVMDRIAGKPEQRSLFDLSDITDQQFFERAEVRVIDALRQYAERAHNGQGLRRQLFTEDAVHGFAFVDVCHSRYDILLMNPPFGEASVPSRTYLYSSVPSSTQDLGAAFIERWSLRLSSNGLLGAITSRLVFFKDLLSTWRQNILLGPRFQLRQAADLGYGVLDEAVVEAAAYVVGESESQFHACKALTFISALASRMKASHLQESIAAIATPKHSESVHYHRLASFSALPVKTLPYWCSRHWLDRFTTHPKAQSLGVIAKKGLETGDDFRQLRLIWEVPLRDLRPLSRWTPYSKGGDYCPFQMDIHMAFDYRRRDEARRTSNSELYGKAGLTYTERTTSNLGVRILPSGSLFSPSGPGIFIEGDLELWGLLGFTNSSVAVFYAELLVGGGDSSEAGTAARHFTPTMIETMPVPATFRAMLCEIAPLAKEVYFGMKPYHGDETSARFTRPYLDFESILEAAKNSYEAYEGAVVGACQAFAAIDEVVARHYKLHSDELSDLQSQLGRPLPSSDLSELPSAEEVVEYLEGSRDSTAHTKDGSLARALTKLGHKADMAYERAAYALNVSPVLISQVRRKSGFIPSHVIQRIAEDTCSYLIGLVFGRWDITKIVGSEGSEADQTFEELQALSPGMLQGSDGSPATRSPNGYPVRIAWDGLLVDDTDHTDDIVRRIREVLELVWNKQGETIEKEVCDILNVKDVREYFRKPGKGGFWDDHVSRYSKSRRKAPIYWLLQSSKKNYAVWLYYHRLDKDLLFKALLNYVEPKIRLEKNRLEAFRSQKTAAGDSGKEAKRLAKEVERQEDFLSELRDFEDKLRLAANLRLEPDLNDGVVLNIAPLHELVPSRDAEIYWKELIDGKHEWSSIAKQLRQKGLVK